MRHKVLLKTHGVADWNSDEHPKQAGGDDQNQSLIEVEQLDSYWAVANRSQDGNLFLLFENVANHWGTQREEA